MTSLRLIFNFTMIKCHIFIAILVFLVERHYCDVFSSIEDLEEVIKTEHILINSLENYIKTEEQKIYIIKRYVSVYQKQRNRAREDPQSYLANPINAYKLIKRLTVDWTQVEAVISRPNEDGILANIPRFREHMKFPTHEDLTGAIAGLMRLQDTYRVDLLSLARGELNGVKYSEELSAVDCVELGRESYIKEDYYHTKLWMKEAESKSKSDASETVTPSEILEYLAISAFQQGNISLALNLTDRLLETMPTHSRALSNKIYYEDQIKEIRDKETIQRRGNNQTENPSTTELNYTNSLDLYKAICRREVTIPVEVQAKLKCRYVSRDNPFLKIGPFKVEEASLSPDLYIFHDVISDVEIETIKQFARPKFKRSLVFTKTGWGTTNLRIGKTAWLTGKEHKHIADVSQRIVDMTGLSMEAAELLQVVNYGIGGHYEPHFDFVKPAKSNNLEIGNRMATVLFYMTDVEQGGATVFPFTRAAVWPRKGTAAFWYNRFPSGESDKRTIHASCPVLVGSKWVCNRWISGIGQEFLRPCTKERCPEEFIA